MKSNNISQMIMKTHIARNDKNVIAILYALYLRKINNSDSEVLSSILKLENDSEIAIFLKNQLSIIWEDIVPYINDFNEKELAECILTYSSGLLGETPQCVSQLACQLLNINDGDSVADYGCGSLSFIKHALSINCKASYTGIEINPEYVMISKIRAKLLGGDITVEEGNMLEFGYNRNFNKIFSNYPFGMRISESEKETPFFKNAERSFSSISKATSLDWIYNELIMTSLKENGKAVVVTTCGSVYNTKDAAIRKYFVERGYVEAVITLPERLFSTTLIPTMLIVLSKGNKGVKFIDSKDNYTVGRRNNTLSDTDIRCILDLYCDNSTFKTIDEIKKNNFNLNPVIYNEQTPEFENSIEFGEVIKKITRGAHCTSKELDELASEVNSDYKYLMLSSIKDGIIDDELPSLKEMPKKFEKYLIQEGDIVISKNGAPIKVAVAENIGNKKILANGSLYIITVDTEKVSPYYIKAFLESNTGKTMISKIVIGAVIPNIPKENLMKLQIPILSHKQQEDIISKSKLYSSEIKKCTLKLSELRTSAENLF